MIDIHTHIIPNVDDGSVTENETLLMIKEARRVGFTDIICTPHYRKEYHKNQNELEFKKIQKLVENKGINIYLGREIFISDNIIELLKKNKIGTLNKSKYMLIEFPFQQKINNLSLISFLLKENGIIPILAHPERYDCVKKNPQFWAKKFIRNGWLMQCNYGSLIGLYGNQSKIAVKKLIKFNYVHFLASDIHHPKTIYKKIPKIIKKLQKITTEERINQMTVINPKRVLKNENIDIEVP